MLRAKYSAGFFCTYQLDPKFYKSENNWKENKKCRHQWECHSNPHADTMCQQNTCPTCPMWRGTVNVPDNCCPVQMGMKAPEASAIVRRWQAEKCGDNN